MTKINKMTSTSSFWEKAKKTKTGCWLWTGAKSRRANYICGTIDKDCKTLKAHRVAWELTYGPIPKGMFICHKCDVPLCVNPAHLFLGTNKDNIQDCIAKGRFPLGIRHRSAKLTESEVRKIRRDPRSVKQIAADYGVNPPAISKIKHRQRWRHLSD